ncbi:hypothetical protein ABIE09_005008 [Lysobacter enzymogenes]|uniref:DUF6289 family protein n=1 Tax=Lysobacter enzymogenes TaxID=69 RepID=UPI00089C375C|nr:DUF6289 family protein [Lysobacter enzymogenes]SDW71729.1 hypothetical protein SAMN05421681_102630 [Lysobacter enzymogenes]
MRKAALAVFVLVLAAGAAVGVHAAPPYQGYSVSYYDAAGELVGGVTAHCSGELLQWGVRTEHYQRRTWVCD